LGKPPEPSPLERFCDVLAAQGVEFSVVGGQAEALMGSARVTYIARPRDRESLLHLEAIKRLREREQR
jgi:hypothetical protein